MIQILRFTAKRPLASSARTIAGAVILTTLAGCASFGYAPRPGEPEQQVVATLGQPTHRYGAGDDHLLEYASGPFGQQTWMARIGPDGRLRTWEQVLTTQKFATIRVGQDTREDVLRIVGAPTETAYFPRLGLDAWTYPYKEAGAWDSLMHIYFDAAGTVRRLENGPDPSRDPERRRMFR